MEATISRFFQFSFSIWDNPVKEAIDSAAAANVDEKAAFFSVGVPAKTFLDMNERATLQAIGKLQASIDVDDLEQSRNALPQRGV